MGATLKSARIRRLEKCAAFIFQASGAVRTVDLGRLGQLDEGDVVLEGAGLAVVLVGDDLLDLEVLLEGAHLSLKFCVFFYFINTDFFCRQTLEPPLVQSGSFLRSCSPNRTVVLEKK